MDTEKVVAAPLPPVAANGHRENPYVGPKPLQSCDELYGRDRELRDLCDLLVGERLVLLYSPSGAGKTSLINAGLIKQLREREQFRVLPPLRVNMISTTLANDHPNRYVRSVAECLLTGLSEEQRASLAASSMPSLSDYLRQRPRCALDGPSDSRFEVMIFDQFEEICTLDPTDGPTKEQFFGEVREALRDRNRWALFVIREDHLAELDALSHLLPTALCSRFRLNLLTVEQARDAIAKPAVAMGRPFQSGHVNLLAQELAKVTVPGPHGPQQVVGTTVEPVQLQVVCRRLWEQHVAGKIAVAEALKTGGVDDALEGFYDAAIEKTAKHDHGGERRLREWIERYLIVKPAMRNQILRGDSATEGLPNDCVSALVAEHLLRFDRRNNREWIEITHDRMLAPMISSNEKWRAAHLQLYQKRADLWDQGGRDADMLLSRKDYDDAIAWQSRQTCLSSEVEADYLDASRAALEQGARLADNARKIRLLRGSLLSGMVALLLVLVAFTYSLWQQEQWASIDKLTGEAQALPQGQYQATLHNAVRAYDLWKRVGAWQLPMPDGWLGQSAARAQSDRLLAKIHAALLSGLVSVPPALERRSLSNDESAPAVRQLTFNPARELLAGAGADGSVVLWDLQRIDTPLQRIRVAGQAYSLSFNANGSLLAVGGSNGAEIWRMASSGAAPSMHLASLTTAGRVAAVAFDGDSTLAVAEERGTVTVYRLDSGSDVNGAAATVRRQAEFHHGGKVIGPISAITFVGSDKLAFGDQYGNVWLWPWQRVGGAALGTGGTVLLNFFEPGPVLRDSATRNAGIAELVYHPGTDQLAASGWIRRDIDRSSPERRSFATVWREASSVPRRGRSEGWVGRETVGHALAFSPDGAMLAFSGSDSRTLSFAATKPKTARVSAAPVRFQERLFSVAFSPYARDRGKLVAVGDGESISLLDLRQSGPLPTRALPLSDTLDAPAATYHAAMSDDGRLLALAAGSRLALHDASPSTGVAPASWAAHPSAQSSAHATVGTLRGYTHFTPVQTVVEEINALAIEPRGGLVALAGPGAEQVVLLERDGREVARIAHKDCTGAPTGGARIAYRLAFRPRSGVPELSIASGGHLCVARLEGGAVRMVPSYKGPVVDDIRALAYSGDGSRLAVLEGDSTIRVHGGRDAPLLLAPPVSRVTAMAFADQRRYLAVGTSDSDIWIADLEKLSWSRLDQLHDAEIRSLHFASARGADVMVSSDLDGRVMMWERTRDNGYHRLGRPLTPKGGTLPVALSGDGELLLTGGATPRMFDLRMPGLLALACNVLPPRDYASCPRHQP
jgi:WD40 repeat protein